MEHLYEFIVYKKEGESREPIHKQASRGKDAKPGRNRLPPGSATRPGTVLLPTAWRMHVPHAEKPFCQPLRG